MYNIMTRKIKKCGIHQRLCVDLACSIIYTPSKVEIRPRGISLENKFISNFQNFIYTKKII